MGYAIRQEGEVTRYIGAGDHHKTLPPGVYDVELDPFAGTYLVGAKLASDELMDIPGTAADDVMRDVRAFLERRSQYERYGLVHRRGYLLYGPPGTGKSCTAQLVARRFINDGGVVLYLKQPIFMPYGLEFLQAQEPQRNVMVLMEDPDEQAMNRTEVLAYLDGTKPVTGLVTVVTTNFKSKMAPRIANRPGRFDRVILVDRIARAVQLKFLETLQGRDPDGPKVAEQIVDALDGVPLTMAHLKEAFLAHVLLDTPLPEIRARFEAMASQENTDDGVQAQTAVEVDEYDDPDDDFVE